MVLEWEPMPGDMEYERREEERVYFRLKQDFMKKYGTVEGFKIDFYKLISGFKHGKALKNLETHQKVLIKEASIETLVEFYQAILSELSIDGGELEFLRPHVEPKLERLLSEKIR